MSVISDLFKGSHRGPAQPVITANTAPYCMERISDTEAEITLYGDIVQRRPMDWNTGKPSEGQFIILSEFLKDLKAIEDPLLRWEIPRQRFWRRGRRKSSALPFTL